MTTTQLLIVCVFALLVAVVLMAGLAAWTSRGVSTTDREGAITPGVAVTVHTRKPDDQTIHGVVIADTPERLILHGAKYVTAAGDSPIPSPVVIPTTSVSWLQTHGADDGPGEPSRT